MIINFKTHRQTGQGWKLRATYTGFQISWLRSTILIPLYFMSLDVYRRLTNEVFGEASHPIDKFFIRPFNAGGMVFLSFNHSFIIFQTILHHIRYCLNNCVDCHLAIGVYENTSSSWLFR